MAQVDAFRFLAHLQELFAPKITEGQVFFAYIDEDNSFNVLADNVIQTSSNQTSSDLTDVTVKIASLQSQADNLEEFCKSIPGLQTQLETISGSSEGIIDFAWASITNDIIVMGSLILNLENRIAELEATVRQLTS